MEQFIFERPKANYDAAFVEIDISEWLLLETIQDVAFSAVDSGGGDATSEVLDLGRSGFLNEYVYPYIRGGIDLERYTVLCQVSTIEGSFQEFRIKFKIREAP